MLLSRETLDYGGNDGIKEMTAGKLHDTSDLEIKNLMKKAHRLSRKYNALFDDETEEQEEILKELLISIGSSTYIQAPIFFDFGNTTIGNDTFINCNLTVLDSTYVNIGNRVFIGPNCTLATPIHPYCKEERCFHRKEDGTVYDLEYAKPITIGDDCWLATNVVVCAGVTIGEGCVIGAGSVVTRDIPPNSLAAGNPCRVIRQITEKDSVYLKEELF